MFTFTDAVIIACRAHSGQKDKGGEDYIKHPLHLAYKCRERGYSNEVQMTAVLHDVVEDGNITFEELERNGCPESVIMALKLLTHVTNDEYIASRISELRVSGKNQIDAMYIAQEDEYLKYISLISTNHIARLVKLEDLTHNSDLNRIPITAFNNPAKLQHRMLKYAKAKQLLTGGLLN